MSCRSHILAATALALAVVAPSARAQAVDAKTDAAQCGAYRAENRQARDLITRGKLAEAQPIVAGVLKAEPKNITAGFLAGWMKLSDPSVLTQRDGLREMERAAALIPGRPVRCAKERNWYSLHVTIGAEYYNRGDRDAAKAHYAVAYAQRALLEPQSKQILLENMGRVALSEGDTETALLRYKEGEQAGLPGAASMISRIRRLQTAR